MLHLSLAEYATDHREHNFPMHKTPKPQNPINML